MYMIIKGKFTELCILNVAIQNCIHVFYLAMTCLALNSAMIYSVSYDMIVRVWDRVQMNCVDKFMHADWVLNNIGCRSVQFFCLQ
jgi:hypothetical protein